MTISITQWQASPDRIQARLGIKINYLSEKRGFDHWLAIHDGLLPSPQMRWCTVKMKIVRFIFLLI
jgi:hypothetical protein